MNLGEQMHLGVHIHDNLIILKKYTLQNVMFSMSNLIILPSVSILIFFGVKLFEIRQEVPYLLMALLDMIS